MIDLKGTMGIPLLKKSRFTGSCGAVRYLLERRSSEEDGDSLTAVFWRGELCSDATPDEEKTTRHFPFTEEGLREAQAWLSEQL